MVILTIDSMSLLVANDVAKHLVGILLTNEVQGTRVIKEGDNYTHEPSGLPYIEIKPWNKEEEQHG